MLCVLFGYLHPAASRRVRQIRALAGGGAEQETVECVGLE
jgi:hypothetical protein